MVKFLEKNSDFVWKFRPKPLFLYQKFERTLIDTYKGSN